MGNNEAFGSIWKHLRFNPLPEFNSIERTSSLFPPIFCHRGNNEKKRLKYHAIALPHRLLHELVAYVTNAMCIYKNNQRLFKYKYICHDELAVLDFALLVVCILPAVNFVFLKYLTSFCYSPTVCNLKSPVTKRRIIYFVNWNFVD